MNQETFYAMALTRLTNFNFQQALELYKHRNEIGDLIEGPTPRLIEALKDWGDAMKRAEAEVKYMEEHKIRAYTLLDDDYPQRLLECADAPLVLYYIGNADLNQTKIISIVGTRQITTYGKDLCRKFIRELHEMCPQVLVVSGWQMATILWLCWPMGWTRYTHITIAIQQLRWLNMADY